MGPEADTLLVGGRKAPHRPAARPQRFERVQAGDQTLQAFLDHGSVATTLESGMDEARAQAAEVLRVQPKFSAEGFVKKMPYKNKAETERLIDALLKAGLR